MFESQHSVFLCDGFDGFCIYVGDIATEKAGDFVGDDELFHDNGTTRIAKGVFRRRNRGVEDDIFWVETFDTRESFANIGLRRLVGLVRAFRVGQATDEALGDN